MAEYIVLHGIRVAKEFVPETFGRLTTIGPKFLLPVGNQNRKCSFQVVICDCGNVTCAQTNSIRGGTMRSCGCLKRLHGICNQKKAEYRIWCAMHHRCKNNGSVVQKNHGLRGIGVCDRWSTGKCEEGHPFLNFLQDMGPRPSDKHSLDRIDVNGDYCPENCRWATSKEQNRNRRNNHMLEYNGVAKTLAEWSDITGIHHNTLRMRLCRGWTAAKALTQPPKP